MKCKLLLAAAISTALIGCNQQAAESVAEKPMTLETDEQRVSYGMGIGLGQRIKQETFAIDVDAFSQGVKHAINGEAPLMTQEEIMAQMQSFQQQQMAKQQETMSKAAEVNKAEGDAFMADNATKEGVVTLESGLQYRIITEGEGAKPTVDDTVEVHYSGTLLDKTEFDSSYKRGSTGSFPVDGVIPGWTEALQLMPVGSKWELYIPADLAYGPGGTGGPIGPNQTLVFEVELIAIKDAAEG